MANVFITGISGMDGSYLAEMMLEKKHNVHGILRRHSVAENQSARINHIRPQLNLYYGDMLDSTSLEAALIKSKPDYVFHLAAQSFVRASFDIPEYTTQVNYNGTLRLLELCKRHCPNAHIYFAASSEMFGKSVDSDNYQRETTAMNPVSPYGISKLAGFNVSRHFRRAYGMHISCGILFNHCSERRGASFVEQKIVKTAVEIKRGLTDSLTLGNINAKRDWGYAPDYVRQMWAMVTQLIPNDYVVATGSVYSIKDICKIVFEHLGMNYENYIKTDPIYMRDEELPYLRGDSTKAKEMLGWTPTRSLNEILHNMTDYWLKKTKNG